MAGGELITKPLAFSGKSLTLNFATSAAGGIRVEIQDAAGKPMAGFGLDDCEELYGDTVAREISWKNNPDRSSTVRPPGTRLGQATYIGTCRPYS